MSSGYAPPRKCVEFTCCESPEVTLMNGLCAVVQSHQQDNTDHVSPERIAAATRWLADNYAVTTPNDEEG